MDPRIGEFSQTRSLPVSDGPLSSTCFCPLRVSTSVHWSLVRDEGGSQPISKEHLEHFAFGTTGCLVSGSTQFGKISYHTCKHLCGQEDSLLPFGLLPGFIGLILQ